MANDSDLDIIGTIKDRIQSILNRKFSRFPFVKRKIDIFHDRINFCCPYCGDSLTDNRKKRGNLYLDNLHYKCYNCGYHTGINKFLADFDEKLSAEDRIAVHEIQQSAKKFEMKTSSQSSISMSVLEKIAIPKQILFKELELVSPYKNQIASSYLMSRKIEIGLWKHFAYNPKTQELYVLNISPDNRVIGFQVRQLDPNSKKPRYLTSSLSKIYKNVFYKDLSTIIERVLNSDAFNEKFGNGMGQKYIEDEDGIENVTANIDKLSGLFNIMNVDFHRTVTITEGPIDSMSIQNSIALQGASKDVDKLFDDVETVRYVFDNDKAGREMSIKKLKSGKTVFLWTMYLKEKKIKNIKDLNDLQKSNTFDIDLINRCFSETELDIIMI